MGTREEALAQIAALAAEHRLSQADIAKAMHAPEQAKTSTGGIARKVFSYLGGIFVFAGISVYIGMFWGDMNSAMRVIITLGTGFVLFILGVLATRDERYRRAETPLFLLSGMIQPGGLFVLIDEYFHGGTDARYACLAVFGIMLAQQGFTYLSVKRPVLMFFALVFLYLFLATAFDLLGVKEEWISMILGGSMMCVASALDKAGQGGMARLGYTIGSISFLAGCFAWMEGTPFELLYLGITCAMIYLSVVVRSTQLLVVSVLAMLSYIGYFTAEHFVRSVGWPVSLIILGVIFLAVSSGAAKIKRQYF